MRLDAQVGIIGAGPAGGRAAELLAGFGADVLMFDPRAPWEKPCGGGLTAAALDNVPELRELVPAAQTIRVVRLEACGTQVEFPLERPLHVLSRLTLGRWQLRRARAAGAKLVGAAVRQIGRLNGAGWQLETEEGESFRVRLLVGADGAASRVRRIVAPGLRIELDPARVAYVPGLGSTPDAIGIRFFPGLSGYAWDFPRPGHRSFGVGVARGTWDRRRMDLEVDRYRDDRDNGGRRDNAAHPPPQRSGAVIPTAARRLGRRYRLLGGHDYALLGDAAGFADPATGEGIQNAMRSAELLAEAFSRGATFRDYPRFVEVRFEPEFVIARRVKRVLYKRSFAAHLVRLAERYRSAYALAAVVVNGGNAHDPSLVNRFLAEWRRCRNGRCSGNGRGSQAPPDRRARDASG